MAIKCPKCGHTGLKMVETEVVVERRGWMERLFQGDGVKIRPTGAASLCLRCGFAFMASLNGPYQSVFMKNEVQKREEKDLQKRAQGSSERRRRSIVPDPDMDLGQEP